MPHDGAQEEDWTRNLLPRIEVRPDAGRGTYKVRNLCPHTAPLLAKRLPHAQSLKIHGIH